LERGKGRIGRRVGRKASWKVACGIHSAVDAQAKSYKEGPLGGNRMKRNEV